MSGQEENIAIKAIYLWELFQHSMVHEANELPIFYRQYLLRLLILCDVGYYDLTIARQQAFVSNNWEVRDVVLRNWTFNSRMAIQFFTGLLINQFGQIVIEKRYFWSTVLEFVHHSHDLHIFFAIHEHAVDEAVLVVEIAPFM